MLKRPSTLTVVLLLLSPAALQSQERFTLEGRRVAVYNLAGEIRVVPGSGQDVMVLVDREGPDGDRLSVELDRIQGRSSLRVIYPGDRVVYPMEGRARYRTSVRMRDDGTWQGGSWGGGRRGREVRITGAGEGLEAHAVMEIQVPAGVDVQIFQAVGPVVAGGVDADLRVDVNYGPVEVRDLRGRVDVDTGSGAIRAEGIDGELTLDTGSGAVELTDVVGPLLFVDTGSGSVSGSGIRAERVEVDTGSGSVEFVGLEASEILVDTGSGSVELELLSDVDELNVDTGAGGVTLYLPIQLGAEVEVDTGSGRIDLDLSMDVRRRERDYLAGIIGDGRGRIVVDTGAGSVRLLGRS